MRDSCGSHRVGARPLLFLVGLLAGALFSAHAPLRAAPVRSISLAPDIPVTLPRAAGSSAGELWGPMVGGALGQIVTEVGRAQKAPPLPPSDYGAVDALRSAVTRAMREKHLLARPGEGEAELRLRILECSVNPVNIFSPKRLAPVLSVQAQLLNRRGQITWEERRRIHHAMSKSPKIPREEFLANPASANRAMEEVARIVGTELVQALVTPGSGHQWDAIRR